MPRPLVPLSARAPLFVAGLLLLAGGCGGDAAPPPAGPAPDRGSVAWIEAACERFRSGAAVPREGPDPRLRRVQGLVGQGRFEDAREAAEPVVADRPGSARARLYLGLAHHKAKRYAEARPHLEEALVLGPTFDKAYGAFYFYGWCRYWLGDLREAKAAFEAFLRFQRQHDDAWFGIGLCAMELGRFEEAESALSRSLELATRARRRSDVAKVHARLGELSLLQDDLAAARRYLEQCVRLFPGHPEPWHMLSRVCARMGDQDRAEEARREFARRRRR